MLYYFGYIKNMSNINLNNKKSHGKTMTLFYTRRTSIKLTGMSRITNNCLLFHTFNGFNISLS